MNDFDDFDESEMFPHKVLEHKYDGIHALQFTDGKYNGIIFSYGKVELPDPEDNDVARLAFEYDIHDNAGIETVKEELEEYLGNFLVQLILYGIKKNNISYTGGIDEDRNSDIIESDI